MASILVIDDDPAFREGLAETIVDLGHFCVATSGAKEALALLNHSRFDGIFVDSRMPGIGGVETMKMIQKKMNTEMGVDVPPLVMITAYSDSQNTIAAMSLGAFDHVTKPVSRDQIAHLLRLIEGSAPPTDLAKKVRGNETPSASVLLGNSEKMREVLKLIGRLAATDSSVLITGETGTGKEVVATAIQENSRRKEAPFIKINCAAIPENLLESELFGHVRGAFTGAATDRRGSFQMAEGGTLFLDEIGDMNPTLQAKILRAVQEREVTPIGSSRPVKINVRILAATHRDLGDLVRRGLFREDLFYRLNVIELHLPPLRERQNDIQELCAHFLEATDGRGKVLTPAALEKFKLHSWPGNIRELKNVIERASVVAKGPRIEDDDVRFVNPNSTRETPQLDELDWHGAIASLERQLLTAALREAEGNRSEAARRLGIQRQLLYAKLKEHRLRDA